MKKASFDIFRIFFVLLFLVMVTFSVATKRFTRYVDVNPGAYQTNIVSFSAGIGQDGATE